jgi:hypothetical protein
MRWLVKITDARGNDRLLRDVLSSLSVRILEEPPARFLVSDKFDLLDTPGEIHTFASRIASLLSEARKTESHIDAAFVVGNVFENLPNGSRTEHKFAPLLGQQITAQTGVLLAKGSVASVALSEAERKRLEEEQREREYQQLRRKAISLVVSAVQDDRALQVQRFLTGELTPLTMGHVADLIQDDIGGAMKDLLPGNQLSRFYRSINHPDVFGAEARHIVTNVEPPPNRMELQEAREFIRALADRWMERKSGLDG